MYVKSLVSECDFINKCYSKPVEGADLLCQGATGRWCCVMTVGPEWLTENKPTVISYEDAREACMEILRKQNNNRPSFQRFTEAALYNFLDF